MIEDFTERGRGVHAQRRMIGVEMVSHRPRLGVADAVHDEAHAAAKARDLELCTTIPHASNATRAPGVMVARVRLGARSCGRQDAGERGVPVRITRGASRRSARISHTEAGAARGAPRVGVAGRVAHAAVCPAIRSVDTAGASGLPQRAQDE